jgi:hypothetical protein
VCRSTVLTKSTELSFLTELQFNAVIAVTEINSEAAVMSITVCSIVKDEISAPYLYGKEPPVVDSEISKKIIMQT